MVTQDTLDSALAFENLTKRLNLVSFKTIWYNLGSRLGAGLGLDQTWKIIIIHIILLGIISELNNRELMCCNGV